MEAKSTSFMFFFLLQLFCCKCLSDFFPFSRSNPLFDPLHFLFCSSTIFTLSKDKDLTHPEALLLCVCVLAVLSFLPCPLPVFPFARGICIQHIHTSTYALPIARLSLSCPLSSCASYTMKMRVSPDRVRCFADLFNPAFVCNNAHRRTRRVGKERE